jgi:PKD repeat protein
VVFYNTEGNYDVQLIVSNGIDTDTLLKTAYIHVDSPVGCEELGSSMTATVMPNPNNGSFMLKATLPESENLVVRIYNLIGTVVYQETVSNAPVNLLKQVSLNLPDGIYILNIRGESATVTRRIIVTK